MDFKTETPYQKLVSCVKSPWKPLSWNHGIIYNWIDMMCCNWKTKVDGFILFKKALVLSSSISQIGLFSVQSVKKKREREINPKILITKMTQKNGDSHSTETYIFFQFVLKSKLSGIVFTLKLLKTLKRSEQRANFDIIFTFSDSFHLRIPNENWFGQIV